MQIWIILYSYIAFGLQEKWCACGEVEEKSDFEGSIPKGGADSHGVTVDFIKEEAKVVVELLRT